MVAQGIHYKKGKEAAYDDRISMYPTEKIYYNSYFDNILKIKNVKVKFKSILKSINLKKKKLILMVKKLSLIFFNKYNCPRYFI